MRRALLPALLALAACAPRGEPARDYLYLWTASADSTQPDFLAVLDVTAGDTGRYGELVTTLAVPGLRNVPHHTEHELAPDRRLFANGFGAGLTWVFDLSSPAAPRIAAEFGDLEGYHHPHSFLLLPNGNRLAAYQMTHGAGGMRNGGLVEVTPDGRAVRSGSGDFPGADPNLRVYSAGVVPALDRVVTTSTDMDGDYPARHLQVWRLSDLTLLHTFALPDGPAGGEGMYSAEPRVLADGKTVLVSTFNCGLYLLEGLETDAPSARLVSSFPRREGTYCAIPVIAGNHYLVTVPAWSAVVALDISDPANPREVSRAAFGPGDVPHWISLSPDGRRVVLTGYGTMKHRVELLTFDPATGALARDERFREPGASEPGFRMEGKAWPHGGSAAGVPHGAVFSRR